MMQLLFPQNEMLKKLPEPIFEAEYDAARAVGFNTLLYSEEMRSSEGPIAACRHFPEGDGSTLLYRGWIYSEQDYLDFYHALGKRGYRLVSSPEQYAEVTYLPNYYPKIRELSPLTVWTETPDTFEAYSCSRKLGNGPFILKDHVKSVKHLWHEACFVPEGIGREGFEEMAARLYREQGKSFHRGFVVKQFVPLSLRGDSPREYPQCEEYRLFFWNSKLLAASHYFNLPALRTEWESISKIAARFTSPFFTMDVAETVQGDWLVVDMGAGECSSIPPSLPAETFYQRLMDSCC
ncbi:MAG: ATP-grasp domain-containing protein [Zavarzinella sp.]